MNWRFYDKHLKYAWRSLEFPHKILRKFIVWNIDTPWGEAVTYAKWGIANAE